MRKTTSPLLAGALALDRCLRGARLRRRAPHAGLRGRRRVRPHPLLPRADGVDLLRGLLRRRRVERALPDAAATAATTSRPAAAIELGLVFCLLATLSGSIWARVEWGAFWNWDPRQLSITLLLVYYAAYLALRGQIADARGAGPGDRRLRRARAGGRAVPALRHARGCSSPLHPEPVINAGDGGPAWTRRSCWLLLAGVPRLHGAILLDAQPGDPPRGPRRPE